MNREELLEELRIAVDVLLDDGYMREKGMVIKAIEAALTALQSEREAVVRECAAECVATYPEYRGGDEGIIQSPCYDTPAECAAAILKLLEKP